MNPQQPILVFITQSPLHGYTLYEALVAIFVLSTYGQPIQLAFCHEAIQLLSKPNGFGASQRYKSLHGLIESLEFYDLLPVWVCDSPAPVDPLISCQPVRLDDINLNAYQAVLRW